MSVPVISSYADAAALANTYVDPRLVGKAKGYAAGLAISSAIISFFAVFAVVWIILFTFNPKWVRRCGKGDESPCETTPADPARCFVGAIVITLIIAVLIWLFASCM